MPRKGLRRLDLWLPETHPIWGLPAGIRSEVARTWLDLGWLEARLAAIEARLAALEELVKAGPPRPPAPQDQVQDRQEAVRKFLAAFE